MTDPGPRAVPVAASLREEIAGYHRLLDILAREQAALLQAQPDALPGIALAKQHEVQALARLAAARAAAGEATWRAAAAWEELRALAARAQDLNAVIGMMIQVRQGYVDRALSALHRAAGRTPVYGADGRAQVAMVSRHLAAI